MASDHMGVDIAPETVADGTLLERLDPRKYPQRALGDGSVTTAADPAGPETADAPGTLAAATATTGGTLPAGTYSYDVTAVAPDGESVSASVNATTTGTTGKVTLTWTAPAGETGGYKVYRDGEHLADVAHATLTYVDTGAVAPAGAEPKGRRGRKSGQYEGAAAPQPVDSAPDAAEEEGGEPATVVE